MGGERELISLQSILLLEKKNIYIYISLFSRMPFADTISTGRVAAASLGKAGLIVSSTP